MTIINFIRGQKHYIEIYVSNFKPLFGGFPCQQLCNHQMKRPHLTCIPNGCGIHKIYYGKKQNPQPIDKIYQIIFYKSVAAWRKIIVKKVLSIAEWILNC